MAAPNSVPPMQRILQTNEKVTGPAGEEMIRRSGLLQSPSTENLVILDNACGGGILTSSLLTLAAETKPNPLPLARVVATDLDETMVRATQVRFANTSSHPSLSSPIEVAQQNQQDLTLFEGNTFSHVFNNFGIFFAPNSGLALRETHRVVRAHSGIVGFTSWKSIKWWPTLAEPALAKVMPDAPSLPAPATLFPETGWSQPEVIPSLLEKAGFVDVRVEEYAFGVDVLPEEFAEACAFLVKVVAKRVWSEQDQERYLEKIQPAMLEYLLQNYPDGKWSENMTAIITLGRKP